MGATRAYHWPKLWERHLDRYLRGAPRVGAFVLSYAPRAEELLEVACGSSRASVFLAEHGRRVVATDREEALIEELRRRFPVDNLTYRSADAFHLPFADNAFDLVFHSGFFVLFDDEQIPALLREQARVSRKYVLALVHNALNARRVDQFRELAKTDELYDIRFFAPDELERVVRNSGIRCRTVRILKYGGPQDRFHRTGLRWGVPNALYPFRHRLVPRLYQWQRWEVTERVAALVELEEPARPGP